MSNHLLIAGGLVVLSFITLGLGLTASGTVDAESLGDPGKTALGPHVIPAARALEPLSREFASEPATNPFTLKKAGEVKQTRLPFPPPPPLELPALPVLPIPER